MKGNSLGETIYSLRHSKGLTQEQLAEGICSPVSLSRIENGRQMPSKVILDALLSRLGASTYQLCDVFYQSDCQRSFSEITRRASLLIEAGKIQQGLSLLEGLSENDASHALERQSVLLIQAAAQLKQNKNPEDSYVKLREALELTKPHIDLSDFRHELLSPIEAEIIGLMVVALQQKEARIEAIRVGEELARNLSDQQSSSNDFTIVRINLEVNISSCLDLEGRFEEAAQHAYLARDLSIESHEQILLPVIFYLIGRSEFRNGNIEKARSIMQTIIPYMELIGQHDNAEMVRAFVEENLSTQN